LADAGNPLFRQLGKHLCRPRADWSHPWVTDVHWCWTGQPMLSLKDGQVSAKITRLSWLKLSVRFLSWKTKAKV
jgi:hypothetical protein